MSQCIQIYSMSSSIIVRPSELATVDSPYLSDGVYWRVFFTLKGGYSDHWMFDDEIQALAAYVQISDALLRGIYN